ncbi:kinase-like domain-containing protein [Lipomyces japonicus]|uniref:kinase-like domain-containing protein n=1 Tax=Lipomyces japonicus TaxID=56871 RepID=UPI0034CE610B
MSTGLLSKRNRQSNGNSELDRLAPPNTPCKRPAQPQFTATSSSLSSFVIDAPVQAGDMDDIGGSMNDFEMPPTPTKAFSHNVNANDSFIGRSKHEPNWNMIQEAPVESSLLSMSPTACTFAELKTPSTPAKPSLGYFDPTLTLNNSLDALLVEKFQDVSVLGTGEFSAVYLVTERHSPNNKYAVKRSKNAIIGHKALQRRLEEVAILKDLSSKSPEEEHEYILHFMDSWDCNGYLYIMTEYCENGNLGVFLAEYGRISRLDEWRVWKILVEIAFGLKFIHDQGYIHLDLKPANIFITFEGTLKIGDFGMATKLPVTKEIEREGDREYIAPEVLASQEYSKPADIFSFGLMMLETAANIVLPDNGLPWHKLRSGDLSDAGRLSSSSGDLRNIEKREGVMVPSWSPEFMTDESDSLDKLVKWMLKPTPNDRPTIEQIVESPEVMLVEARRKAGAIIFEGEFGPEPDEPKDGQDSGMLDQDQDWRMEL